MARHPSPLLRLTYGSALALASIAILALPPTALSAGLSKTITVRPSTLLNMAGSDVYCTVLKTGGHTVVACFHDPGGPTSPSSKGYAIAASDSYAAVEPPGAKRPNVLKSQPDLPPSVFSGGQGHKEVVSLGLNDLAAVGGTHMAILVTTAKGGGNAMGVIYVDANDNPIVGTYTAGISNHYVTVVQLVGARKTKVIYRHAVY